MTGNWDNEHGLGGGDQLLVDQIVSFLFQLDLAPKTSRALLHTLPSLAYWPLEGVRSSGLAKPPEGKTLGPWVAAYCRRAGRLEKTHWTVPRVRNTLYFVNALRLWNGCLRQLADLTKPAPLFTQLLPLPTSQSYYVE